MRQVTAYIIAGILLCGCERVWHLVIVSTANDTPVFCISKRESCTGEGIQLRSIVFTEIDRDGRSVGQVWASQGKSSVPRDYVISRLIYGTVPTGWVQDAQAIPLRRGIFYTLNGEFAFVLLEQGGARVYSLAEFSKMKKGTQD